MFANNLEMPELDLDLELVSVNVDMQRFDTNESATSGNPSINIFRYKFTQEIVDVLHEFSKIHQYDERKVYKEAWNNWVEDNTDLIQSEIRRLSELNYEGDILDKMFKSARYYFRKKSPVKPEPKNRRQYLSVQKELLDTMDEHINENIKNKDFKPSDGFVDFCNKNIDLLKKEVTIMVTEHGINDQSLIQNKIKKTYKNRYFMLVSK